MRGHTWSGWTAALLLGVTGLAPARASVLVRQTTQQLSDEAQLVVHGTVVSQEEGLDAAAHARVVLTTVQVKETWKGSAQGTIVVQQLGRLREGKQVGIAGDAVFTPGEEVVLFLAEPIAPAPAGHWFLLGLGQGKFHVVRPATGTPTVERDVRGAHYVKGSKAPAPTTLPELKRQVLPRAGSTR